MLPRLFVMSVAMLASSLVAAQSLPASRLDAALAGGKIKGCSPDDYKPFSFKRPDGGFEGVDGSVDAPGQDPRGIRPDRGPLAQIGTCQ